MPLSGVLACFHSGEIVVGRTMYRPYEESFAEQLQWCSGKGHPRSPYIVLCNIFRTVNLSSLSLSILVRYAYKEVIPRRGCPYRSRAPGTAEIRDHESHGVGSAYQEAGKLIG